MDPLIRPFEGFGDRASVCLIAPPEAPAHGAIEGPAGFAATAHRVGEGGLAVHSPTHHTVLLVLDGQVSLTEGEPLGPRDSALIRPGERVEVAGAGTVLALAYRERDAVGAWATAGRGRGGVARMAGQRSLRRRFPLRLAPRLMPVLSPLDLFPTVGPTRWGPGRFAIQGPQQLLVVQATTPPGTGPALHIHRRSVEMFVVLKGSYRLFWGEQGEHDRTVGTLGAAVFPTGTNRAFEAVGEGDDWILPVVVGADNDSEDIVWLPPVAEALREAGPRWLAELVLRSGRVRIGRP